MPPIIRTAIPASLSPIRRAGRRTSRRDCSATGCRSGSVSNSSSKTVRAAATISATEAALKSPADGYTFVLTNPANTVNASLYKKLNFDFIRDTDPVAGFIRVPNIMEVHPSVPAKTVAEFIAYVKANPGKVNMASSGNGTSIHLSGMLFMSMTGIQMTHVPYRGSAPALTDLLAGQVHVMFDNLPPSMQHIKAGTLRPLGVTTAQRSPELPDVPSRRGDGAGL